MTLVPIMCTSEITFLPNFSCDQKAWPMYMTMGNILSRTRNKPGKHTTVLLVLLPFPWKMLGVVARDAWQRQVNNEILHNLLERIFAPVAAGRDSGLQIECPDGNLGLCFVHHTPGIADHLENVTIYSIRQNECEVRKVKEARLGSYMRYSMAKRDYRKYEYHLNKCVDGDHQAGREFSHRRHKLLPSVF